MTGADTWILIPFVIAFLLFVFRFYNREGASSITNPTFMLAIGSVLIAGGYLAWGVFGDLPQYGSIVFGIIGVALMAFAFLRLFQL